MTSPRSTPTCIKLHQPRLITWDLAFFGRRGLCCLEKRLVGRERQVDPLVWGHRSEGRTSFPRKADSARAQRRTTVLGLKAPSSHACPPRWLSSGHLAPQVCRSSAPQSSRRKDRSQQNACTCPNSSTRPEEHGRSPTVAAVFVTLHECHTWFLHRLSVPHVFYTNGATMRKVTCVCMNLYKLTCADIRMHALGRPRPSPRNSASSSPQNTFEGLLLRLGPMSILCTPSICMVSKERKSLGFFKIQNQSMSRNH